MSGREQNNYKFTPHGHNINSVAETFVAVICNQLSNIPYIFRHYDLLVLNKSLEQILHIKNNSFRDFYIEGLTVKVY